MNSDLATHLQYIIDQLLPYDPEYIVRQRTALHLLSFITGMTQAQLLTAQSVVLTTSQQQQLENALHALIVLHKPLAYILGWVPFLDVHIAVQPPLLIPRPETEEWVANLIAELPHDQPLRILDVGTGTGCIALALAQQLPKSIITGIDINPAAIACAQLNAQRNAITNVHFVLADIATYKPLHKIDLIVGNPPYIPAEQLAFLMPSVRNWEDPGALIAGDDGLAVIHAMLQAGKEFAALPSLLPTVVLEMDASHGALIEQVAQSHGYYKSLVRTDAQQRPRVLYAWYTAETSA